MIVMIKEFKDLKNEMANSYSNETDSEISLRAEGMFQTIFGMEVKEAEVLASAGKWNDYLKTNSVESFDDSKGRMVFNATDFEVKSEEDGFYVSGFVSAPVPDSSKDFVEQEKLLNKMLDPTNPMSKNLSYGHGWTKGDVNDSEVFGVLKHAELKEHPVIKQPAVWAEYKLMKTHPYYNKAVYNLKENALKGFSIEFNETKRKFVKFGNTIVKKLEDYFLGGVALVGRPQHLNATLTGFAIKEYVFNGGSNMEIKEEVNNAAPAINEVKTDSVKTEDVKTEVVKKEDNQTKDDVAKLKAELDSIKAEKAEEKRKAEIDALKAEIENLKADKKVLVDTTEQNFKNQDPADKKANELVEEVKKIQDSKLSTEEKLRKLAMLELRQ
jgi:hypothetical protein